MKKINDLYLKDTRTNENKNAKIFKFFLIIVVCDLYFISCRQMNYDRFVFLFQLLFISFRYCNHVHFNNEKLH